MGTATASPGAWVRPCLWLVEPTDRRASRPYLGGVGGRRPPLQKRSCHGLFLSGALVREGGEGGEGVRVAAGGEGEVGGLGNLDGDAVKVGGAGVVGGSGELGAADDVFGAEVLIVAGKEGVGIACVVVCFK